MRLRELLQEEVKHIAPYFIIDIAISVNLTVSEFEEVRKALMQIPNAQHVSLYKEMVTFKTERLTQTLCTRDALEDLLTTVHDVITSILEDLYDESRIEKEIEQSTSKLYLIDGLPPFPIEWDEIIIEVVKDFTFTSIEKLISNSELLSIENAHKIKPSGVLSLFKLKNVTDVFFESANPKPEWIKIVSKHLDADKDILECREELIAAGFKDYAKF